MNTGLESYVVLITSASEKTTKADSIGTGFAIYRDEYGTYLVTCAHVVEDMGGEDSVLANGISTKVLVLGNVKGFDLAVLQVEGLSDIPLLKLMKVSVTKKRPVRIVGYYNYGEDKKRSLEIIEGIIYEQTFGVQDSKRAVVLKLQTKQGDKLQKGYSGSPIIDRRTGYVLGVATNLEEQGEFGRAISIEALETIWLDASKIYTIKEGYFRNKFIVSALTTSVILGIALTSINIAGNLQLMGFLLIIIGIFSIIINIFKNYCLTFEASKNQGKLNIIFSCVVLFGVFLRGYALLVLKVLDINSLKPFMNFHEQMLKGLLFITLGTLGLLMLNITHSSQNNFEINKVEGKINLTLILFIIAGFILITSDILSITLDIISFHIRK